MLQSNKSLQEDLIRSYKLVIYQQKVIKQYSKQYDALREHNRMISRELNKMIAFYNTDTPTHKTDTIPDRVNPSFFPALKEYNPPFDQIESRNHLEPNSFHGHSSYEPFLETATIHETNQEDDNGIQIVLRRPIYKEKLEELESSTGDLEVVTRRPHERRVHYNTGFGDTKKSRKKRISINLS